MEITMKRSIDLWQLVGFAVTGLGGTLLHFLYEWSGRLSFVAPFSAVNESTWEHMKLLFWPMLIFAIVQSFFMESCGNFWCVKLRGILLGLATIPILFYTYNGIIGKSPDWVNISIFFIAAAVSYVFEALSFKERGKNQRRELLCLGLILIIAILFVAFTFIPPELNLFKDPETGTFGIDLCK